jgi:hypothetical protein
MVFFNTYSRGVSPQIVIDEIVVESLNVLVSIVEVKKIVNNHFIP